MKTVLIPERNEKDLDEIPKPLRRRLKLVLIKNMADVLALALLDKTRKNIPDALSVWAKKSRPAKKRRLKKREKPLEKGRRERVIPLGA